MHNRFDVIHFHTPVPAKVIDSEDGETLNSAIISGARWGVVAQETGRVYPMHSRDEAFTSLAEFEIAPDPKDIPYKWEPHGSSEYEVVRGNHAN